jgi:hypothetical protein
MSSALLSPSMSAMAGVHMMCASMAIESPSTWLPEPTNSSSPQPRSSTAAHW